MSVPRKSAPFAIATGPSSPSLRTPRPVARGIARASLVAAAASLLACGASEPAPTVATACVSPYGCSPMGSPPTLGGYPPQPSLPTTVAGGAVFPPAICTPELRANPPAELRPLIEQVCGPSPSSSSASPMPSSSSPTPPSSPPALPPSGPGPQSAPPSATAAPPASR